MKKLILILLILYKNIISPHIKPISSCRFTPTCSEYMYEAIRIHGVLKGVFLGVLRFLRCNPFFKGGSDPVPRKVIE